LGLSASTYRSDYGTVAEDAVTIGMKSDRVALEWDMDDLGGWVQSLKVRASQSDYQHTEYEDGEAGTVFKNKGHDLRLVARHANLGPWAGVLGVQSETAQFSADGTGLPYSRTVQNAVFALKNCPWRGAASACASSRCRSIPAVTLVAPCTGEPQLYPAELRRLLGMQRPAGSSPAIWLTASERPKTTSCLPTAPTLPPTHMKWAIWLPSWSNPPTWTWA
jgi:hypothetical protein